jgi:nitrate reductase cytochrome c-type subunit
MDLFDDATQNIREITGIGIITQHKQEMSEKEELRQFIRDYIDEPPPLPRWQNLFAKQLAYSQMYSGRGMSKSRFFGYHNHVIIDEFMPIHENPTFKPTKKHAKLLKKFRKF